MEFKGLRRASLASGDATTAAASGNADLAAATAAAELKNADEDELQGNSEFLPAGACHATEAAKAAAQTVIQAALVSVRNGATPDASLTSPTPPRPRTPPPPPSRKPTRNNSPSS